MHNLDLVMFRTLLWLAAALWLIAGVTTTRHFYVAWRMLHTRRASAPFVTAAMVLGLANLIEATFFAITSQLAVDDFHFTDDPVTGIALFLIPVSLIAQAVAFWMLGREAMSGAIATAPPSDLMD